MKSVNASGIVKPFRYVGGKHYLIPFLLEHMPRHEVWVDVFAGSAAVTLAKPPSPIEVINDKYHVIADLYRVLQDEAEYERFIARAALTPYSRAFWAMCRDTWASCTDRVERVYRWFVTVNQSIDGRGQSWAYDKRLWHGDISACISKWLNRINGLPAVHRRLAQILIECEDYYTILQRYDTANTLFYCDPPYVPDTRVDRAIYEHEMTLEDHQILVERLLKCNGMIMLSGYAHSVYEPLEQAGWRRIETRTIAYGSLHTGNPRTQRTECLWLSPNCTTRQLALW